MATIKPDNIDLNVAKNHSNAETKILKEFLELDPIKTENWVVYYSYYFKKRDNCLSVEGTIINEHNEIDFLVLIPNVGIFVFEIKGGKIEVRNGQIYTINRNNEEFRINPYEQAKRNYYALDNVIGKIKRESGEIVNFNKFSHATLVGFPDVSGKIDVGEKSNGRDTYTSGMNLYRFFMDSLKKQDEDTHIAPTVEDIKNIEKILEGKDYVYSLSKSDYIKAVNLSLSQLTEEQMTVFSGLLENKRCLIKGAAGTGKTILCQFLYNHLVNEKKYTVIYFTFNRLIAERINVDIDTDERSGCYPIFDYLEKLYKENPIDNCPVDYEEKKKFLFSHAWSLLQEKGVFNQYDCLIVDEAQDISDSEEAIGFFEELLNKHLDNGMCYLFYDDNQSIFNSKDKKIYSNNLFGDSEGCYRYAKFKLVRNCRNSKNIINALEPLMINKNGKADNLVNIKQQIVNSDVLYEEVNYLECAKRIHEIVSELTVNGVKNKQITILFNKSLNDDNLIINDLKKIYGEHIKEYCQNNKNDLTYSNVSKFKGLENDVIIYVNDSSYAKASNHYVALSRAKVYSYILFVKN